MTRLALSSYDLWRDILATNSQAGRPGALADYIQELEHIRENLRTGSLQEEFRARGGDGRALARIRKVGYTTHEAMTQAPPVGIAARRRFAWSGLPGVTDILVRHTVNAPVGGRVGPAEKELPMEQKLKIAVFIDFDNIEIGVKSTLHREFDVAAVLDALKERGEIVTKFAYANWGRQESATRALSEHAVQMVQRDPSPRGDKNGADINLALDALEMAFTHDHINAFAIVSGDSDFIALVNKLKQYDKRIFVVGGRAFTSTILQKNCHEFIAYESMIDDRPRAARGAAAAAGSGPAGARRQQQQSRLAGARRRRRHAAAGQPQQQRPPHKRVALDLAQAMPLVERALGRAGAARSASAARAAEIHHAAAGFHVQREGLRRQLVHRFRGEAAEGRLRRGDRRRRPLHDPHEGRRRPEKPGAKPEEAIPLLRDVLETHRLEVDNGATAEELADWVHQDQPEFRLARSTASRSSASC